MKLLVVVILAVLAVSNAEIGPVKELKFKLLNGNQMPMVGVGTFRVKPDEIESVLDNALAAGFRLIDTAKYYENEEAIGKALKKLLPKYKLTREDIFITSKLSPFDQGETAYEALKESLTKLQLTYLDLYLIHTPGAWTGNKTNHENDPNSASRRDKSWEMLVKGQKEGLVKNIGVSNFNTKHMDKILKNDHGVKPVVNQVEYHPFFHQTELKPYLDKEGILLQAYFSLGGTGRTNLLENAEVKKIAEALKKSPAQVLLRWALQTNSAIIPKALSKKHIDENIDLDFVIPEDSMKILNGFPQERLGHAHDVD